MNEKRRAMRTAVQQGIQDSMKGYRPLPVKGYESDYMRGYNKYKRSIWDKLKGLFK
jgi:hypothetical protein